MTPYSLIIAHITQKVNIMALILDIFYYLCYNQPK